MKSDGCWGVYDEDLREGKQNQIGQNGLFAVHIVSFGVVLRIVRIALRCYYRRGLIQLANLRASWILWGEDLMEAHWIKTYRRCLSKPLGGIHAWLWNFAESDLWEHRHYLFTRNVVMKRVFARAICLYSVSTLVNWEEEWFYFGLSLTISYWLLSYLQLILKLQLGFKTFLPIFMMQI